MTETTAPLRVVRVRDTFETIVDRVVVEEPLEMRLDGSAVAVVMRTPGHDEDLATGFAITEGIVTGPASISRVETLDASRVNIVTADGVDIDPAQFQRNFYSTSSCGVCGKASIDAIRVAGARPPEGPVVSADVILTLPAELLKRQHAFQSTGGLHAAALFHPDGDITTVREDVGRHNAVDKVVGNIAAAGWPLPSLGLLVSGRISFEIAQKAAVAGISLVCGVSAASSLAVELAAEFGMTVVGFLREEGFIIYTGSERISPDGHPT